MRNRGRGKSKASHQVSALNHFELDALGVDGLLELEPVFVLLPTGPRRFGVETEDFKLLLDFLRLEKLLDWERNGTARLSIVGRFCDGK